MWTYTCSEIDTVSGKLKSTLSRVTSELPLLNIYTSGNIPVPTGLADNTSWITNPNAWSVCIHVVVRIP